MGPASDPQAVVDAELETLHPNASMEEVTRFLATYNLVAAAVVDNDGRLVGAVTVDDVLDSLLPDDWRSAGPHPTGPPTTGPAATGQDVTAPRPAALTRTGARRAG